VKDCDAMIMFAKVVEFNSFSEAARRLHVSVSKVSRKVSQLERSLGVRLLERSTRRLRLTELGQRYYTHCQRASEEFDAAELMISDKRNDVSGLLRLSIPPSLDKLIVLPLVHTFQKQYPKARIRIWISDRNLDLIHEGIDLAFRVGPLHDQTMIARPLVHYVHVLVAAPSYLKRAGRPQQPSDLDQHRLIGFTDLHSENKWTFNKGKRKETVNLFAALSINDHVSKQDAAEQGLGITELPSILCREAIEQGRLQEILPDWTFSVMSTSQVTLSLVYPSRHNLPRLVRLFVEHCIEHTRDKASLISPVL